MITKPNIQAHNARVQSNVVGDPQPTEVRSIVRRGKTSRYAGWIRQMQFHSIRAVTVAQNTPTGNQGWEKVEMDAPVMQTLMGLDAGTDLEVWIKTATLGGRSKMYVRPVQ